MASWLKQWAMLKRVKEEILEEDTSKWLYIRYLCIGGENLHLNRAASSKAGTPLHRKLQSREEFVSQEVNMEYVGAEPMSRSRATRRKRWARKSQASGDMKENRGVQVLSCLFAHSWLVTQTGGLS